MSLKFWRAVQAVVQLAAAPTPARITHHTVKLKVCMSASSGRLTVQQHMLLERLHIDQCCKRTSNIRDCRVTGVLLLRSAAVRVELYKL
jgi:hypothetical protein